MSSVKWQGFLAPAAFVAMAAVTSNGCSSSSSSGSNAGGDGGGAQTTLDAGAGIMPGRHPDASFALDTGTTATPDAASAAGFDGTTGKICQSNADCKGTDPSAPGMNTCSNSYTFRVDTLTVQLWPTPICMLPLSATAGNCNPGPTGSLQFCDSPDPTDPTSPGVCLPASTLPPPLNGICLPACTFDTSGARAKGCNGNNTCVPFTFLLSPSTNQVLGVGFCQGTCQTDADCAALGSTWGCQTDLGFCTQAKKTRTKMLGAQCTDVSPTGGASDNTTGACNCFSNLNATSGYCTSACVVGGLPCPNGGVCDSLEPSTLTFTGGGSNVVLPGPSAPTPGMSGVCMQPCTLSDAGVAGGGAADGGDAGEGGASAGCPAVSSCMTGTAAGPDCQPM
ncbi:MAG: hypothetical protein JOZ69_11995 [Myxococcales bacterium]|nr:hypothetical protein [Myxococcales bacterium]